MVKTAISATRSLTAQMFWDMGVLKIASLFNLIGRWLGHVGKEFAEPHGWKLLGGAFAVIFSLLAILATFMTYQSSNLDHEMEAAERAYFQLMTDAGSDSVRVRIGAIQRIPLLLQKRAPASSSVGPFEALRLSFGGNMRETPVYIPEMHRLIRDLFAEVHSRNSKEPQRELGALVDLMIDIGPQGWYEGMQRAQVNQIAGLNWIWNKDEPGKHPLQAVSTLGFLKGQPLSGLSFDNFLLEDGDMSYSDITQTSFKNCRMDRCVLRGSSGIRPTFEFAAMNQADFRDASIKEGDFESSSLTNALLSKGSFSNSHFEGATLDQVKALAADFSGSKLMGAQIHGAVLQNAKLNSNSVSKCDLTAASLEGSQMDFADLTGASLRRANLRNVSLRNAILKEADLSYSTLTGADLRSANLVGAKGISSVYNWQGTRIRGILGVSRVQLQSMVKAGAVQ